MIEPDPLTLQARQLDAINEVALALSASMDVDDVITKALDCLLSITGLTSGVVFTLNDTEDTLIGRRYVGFDHGYEEKIRSYSMAEDSFPVRGMRSAEPLVFDADHETQGMASLTERERLAISPEQIKSGVALRLESQVKAHGVVVLSSHHTRRCFSADELRAMQALAGQIGVALERAALYDDQRRQTEEATALYEIGRLLASPSDIDDTISTTLKLLCETFELVSASVYVKAEDRRISHAERGSAPSSPLRVPLDSGEGQMGYLEARDAGQDRPPARQQRLETHLRRVGDMLAMRLHNELLLERSLQVRLIQERSRIARDLHDSLIQSFHAIQLQLAAAESLQRHGDERSLEHVARAQSLALEGLNEARSSVVALRSLATPDQSLEHGVRLLADDFTSDTSIPCQVDVYGLEPTLGLGVRDGLLRSVRELLRNIAKHAHAGSVEVFISFRGNRTTLTIEDDGIGFEPDRAELPTDRFGLIGVAEALQEIGATFSIESAAGSGTTASIELESPSPSPAKST